MQTYEDKLAVSKEGMNVSYKRWTKTDYKGPDSVSAMVKARQHILRSPLTKKQFRNTFPHGSPPQPTNQSSCCFANALVQNIYANHTINADFQKPLNKLFPGDENRSHHSCVQYDLVQKALIEMNSTKDRPGILKPDNVLALLRHFGEDERFPEYKCGLSMDPEELFRYIITKIGDAGYDMHPIVNGELLLSRYVKRRRCNCKPGTPVSVNTEINDVIHVARCRLDGSSFTECLDKHFFTNMEMTLLIDQHESGCKASVVRGKRWISSNDLQEGKCVIIHLMPQVYNSTLLVDTGNRAQSRAHH